MLFIMEARCRMNDDWKRIVTAKGSRKRHERGDLSGRRCLDDCVKCLPLKLLCKTIKPWLLLHVSSSNSRQVHFSLSLSLSFLIMEYSIKEKGMATLWAQVFENIEEVGKCLLKSSIIKRLLEIVLSHIGREITWNRILVTGSSAAILIPILTSDDEKEETVVNAVREDPTKSTRQLSDDLNISHATNFQLQELSSLFNLNSSLRR